MSKIKNYYEKLMYDIDYCDEQYSKNKDDFMAESVWYCHRIAEEILDHSIYDIHEYNTTCLAEWLYAYEFNCNHYDITHFMDRELSGSLMKEMLEKFAEYWVNCGLDFNNMMNA